MANPASVQPQGTQEPIIGGSFLSSLMFLSTDGIAPNWDAMDRDAWLRKFMTKFGNDMLQAVLAVSVAKIQAQNWELEGPEDMALFYRRVLRDECEYHEGYDIMIARTVIDYYTQDNGAFIERQRDAVTTYDGPVLGLAHLDSARMYPTGHSEFPYAYLDVLGNYHLMHYSQFMRFVDLPSPVSQLYYHKKGFCALSRAISTALILTMLVAMKREKLSDLPPSAIAIFNNINKGQFQEAISIHALHGESQSQGVWSALLPLFSVDPEKPASLNFISLREVWDNFDEMTAMNVAAYSFAAAWRMDPREFWPVSAGPLGTGKEAEIQHEKAKAKSHGLLFTALERQFNSELTLPPELKFKFRLQDSDEEEQRASIHGLQITNIKGMQEAGAQFTPEEVRYLLATQKIIPFHMVQVPQEGQAPSLPETVYMDDVEYASKETEKFNFGPKVRLGLDGSKEFLDGRLEGLVYKLSIARKNKEFDHTVETAKAVELTNSSAVLGDTLHGVESMPQQLQLTVFDMAKELLNIMNTSKHQKSLEGISDAEWQAAVSSDTGNMEIANKAAPLVVQPQFQVNMPALPASPPVNVTSTIQIPDIMDAIALSVREAVKELGAAAIVPQVTVSPDIVVQPTPVVIQDTTAEAISDAVSRILSALSPDALAAIRPEVTVNVPPAQIDVTVPAPIVNIPAQPVTLSVQLPDKSPVTSVVHRDESGKIISVEEVRNG